MVSVARLVRFRDEAADVLRRSLEVVDFVRALVPDFDWLWHRRALVVRH